MNSRLLPSRMPFGAWPVLVTRVDEAKHGCDLPDLAGEWGRFTSEAHKGHTLRNSSREISFSSPYSTFSHTSTLPSAVAVILLPSKASGRVPKGYCQINLPTFLLPLRLAYSPHERTTGAGRHGPPRCRGGRALAVVTNRPQEIRWEVQSSRSITHSTSVRPDWLASATLIASASSPLLVARRPRPSPSSALRPRLARRSPSSGAPASITAAVRCRQCRCRPIPSWPSPPRTGFHSIWGLAHAGRGVSTPG
jgi:hypothetical protein